MHDLQQEKKLVLEYFNSINNANSDTLIEIISKYTSSDFKMRKTDKIRVVKTNIIKKNLNLTLRPYMV